MDSNLVVNIYSCYSGKKSTIAESTSGCDIVRLFQKIIVRVIYTTVTKWSRFVRHFPARTWMDFKAAIQEKLQSVLHGAPSKFLLYFWFEQKEGHKGIQRNLHYYYLQGDYNEESR
jgi:hypothetical protein